MTRRIYLAGPMTGYPEHNYPAFRDVTAWLRSKGHYVYSPHEQLPQTDGDRVGTVELRQAFADYCRFICLEADTIVLLPGWKDSRGAKAEHQLAINCKLDVFEMINIIDGFDDLDREPDCPPMPEPVLMSGSKATLTVISPELIERLMTDGYIVDVDLEGRN